MSRLPTVVGVLVDGLLMLLCMLFCVVLVGILCVEVLARGWRNTATWLKWTAAVSACALLLLMVVNSGAMAHENPTDWIGQERVKNAKGELCCGAGDCKSFDAKQMIVTPRGMAFPDEPDNIIPFEKFAPSVDESAWRCRWGGETKCMFAPVGGF